ncbi:MAG TPA: Uma2 family endonuclease, partial [Bacilli bacterium]|nr:Uma2 family endonuclease [Bacilli bacterium]
ELTIYLRGKECAVFGSPIDVCLFAHRNTPDDEIQDWLHPDLVVVCDKDKITTRNIVGAPDLVIEILSPSTARNDRVTKFHRYEKAGVKEYWIVDPLNEYIEVYERQESRFQLAKLYTKEDMLQTSLFEGLKIDLTVVFA